MVLRPVLRRCEVCYHNLDISYTSSSLLTYIVTKISNKIKFAVDYVRLQLRMDYKGLHLAARENYDISTSALTERRSASERPGNKNKACWLIYVLYQLSYPSFRAEWDLNPQHRA